MYELGALTLVDCQNMNLPPTVLSVIRSGPVLVTGAGGFIGRNLIDALIRFGADVIVVTRTVGPRLNEIARSVQIIECDLCFADKLTSVLSAVRPTVVFHLAAGVASGLSNSTIIQSNVVGTANLLAAIETYPLKNFVLVGSGFEYGAGEKLAENSPLQPVNVYGATKAAAHLLAHSFRRSRGLPIISVRPFTPYGPWEAYWRLIPFVYCRALEGGIIPLTAGEQQRDFVFIADVVDALLRAVVISGKDGLEAINICSGNPVTIRQVVSSIIKLSDTGARPEFGALPYRDGEIWVQSGDPTRARDVLGWSPNTTLDTGLVKTMEWILEHRDVLRHVK